MGFWPMRVTLWIVDWDRCHRPSLILQSALICRRARSVMTNNWQASTSTPPNLSTPPLSSSSSMSDSLWPTETSSYTADCAMAQWTHVYHPYYNAQYANNQWENSATQAILMPHYHQGANFPDQNGHCSEEMITPPPQPPLLPTPHMSTALSNETTMTAFNTETSSMVSSTMATSSSPVLPQNLSLHPWMLLKRNTRPSKAASPTSHSAMLQRTTEESTMTTTTSSSSSNLSPKAKKTSLELREKLRGVQLKRPRTSFTIQQQCQLEQEFISNNYICKARRLQLSSDLGLEDKQIKIWFQNRRMKKKKEEAAANHLKMNNVTKCDDPDSKSVSSTNMEDVENHLCSDHGGFEAIAYSDYSGYSPQTTSLTLDLSRVTANGNKQPTPLTELELQQLCK